MRLFEAAQAIGAHAVGDDVSIAAVTTDSRSLPSGALFVALRGERFDGHDFAVQALQQGAAAVMVDEASDIDAVPALRVADTRRALGQLAAWHRSRLPVRVLAITGSNGKTTVKEMATAILRAHAGADAVLATAGNLNNDIGLPLTLLRLTAGHRYAVLEMGMNHAGELTWLSGLARPDVALVNNAQRAHIEGLGSVEAVARAKGEIYSGLAVDGIALVNVDDPHAALWRQLADGRQVVGFGLGDEAEVRAEASADPAGAGWHVTLFTPQGRIDTTLALPGLHSVRNAAAAAAATLALGASPQAVAEGLAGFRGVGGRLQAHACILGAQLIDDTYNANPDSVAAAIQVLSERPGTRILVLGDMAELGPEAPAMHAEIGRTAKAAGIDRLLCLGDLCARAADAFGSGAMHFERIEELLAETENALGEGVTVLIKGSRFMRMERVVRSFMESQICS